jgi:hypothetical protein
LHYIVHASVPAQASISLPEHLSNDSRPGTPLSGKRLFYFDPT